MRISNKNAVVLHDLLMVICAWELAWLARFNFGVPDIVYWWASLKALPLVLVTQGLVSWYFGLYRGLWRFASVPDLVNILRAALLGVLSITVVLFVATRLESVPRSLLILYPVFLILLLGGPRLTYRLWKDHTLNFKRLTAGTRVVIIGAGQAGETLARHMLRDPGYLPIGFVDDKQRFRDARIHGVAVLGTVEELEKISAQAQPDFLVIAIPSANNRQMQRIVAACDRTGIRYRTLPKGRYLATGASYVSELKDVSIEDLLGREKIELDWGLINKGLAGKVVVVTGGGGSIGSELCRQLARIGPSRLVVFERSEYNLFRLERELVADYPLLPCKLVLGDICDERAVSRLFEEYKPDYVFHAAAYKHVALLQHQIREAVRNNVVGTQIVARQAARHGCSGFVFISTDKAVKPTSIMGLCKRVAELQIESMNATQSETRFMTVRFGNVLGSDGSVVPVFKAQIAAGGPVTVTHTEATRFFMTMEEACQLIMQSAVQGEGGEIFVLDMGQPAKITYLAEQMIKLAGLEPGRDIEIVITGLRPGEKLHEELFYDEENRVTTAHPKILLAQHRPVDTNAVSESLQQLANACDTGDDSAIADTLRLLIPDSNWLAERASDGVVQLKTVRGVE